MRLPRHKSLSSLFAYGVLLLVVPLAIAVIHAGLQLRSLAADTDTLVRRGVDLTDRSQSLFRHLAAYERSANLYILLSDPRLLESSRETQRQIAATSDQLAELPLDAQAALALETLRQTAVSVLATLEFSGPEVPNRAELLAARLTELDQAAQVVSSSTHAALEADLATLMQRAASTRRLLLVWLSALLPVSVVLGLVFLLGVLGPLRQADRAIAELGKGGFAKPIAIRGPADIEALGRQLEWLRVRLLDLAQEKNRFLRHMSHELKTPLANIREGTELILDGTVGAIAVRQREVVDIMRDNAVRLQQLIENLLSYGAWQSQQSALEVSAFLLQDELTASLNFHKLALLARRIGTKLDIENVLIEADRAMIRLVFDNLISNALKFAPEEGLITVQARLHGSEVVIDFADDGPGVPTQERESIFRAFYSGSTPQAGHLKGSGIGLSIVADYVGAHGGTVALIQGEFPGAHFRISLPVKSVVSQTPMRHAHA